MREMHELEKTIGYEFKNEGYLRTALTHSSYANEMRSRCPYNERQEFLGDAVLSIIVSDYLFKSSHLAEGDLTKLRASIVCEKSLWGWAKEIHLGDYILLGKGEENSGGRERPSIQADAFEALIAAVYLDSGHGAHPGIPDALCAAQPGKRGKARFQGLQDPAAGDRPEEPRGTAQL